MRENLNIKKDKFYRDYREPMIKIGMIRPEFKKINYFIQPRNPFSRILKCENVRIWKVKRR